MENYNKAKEDANFENTYNSNNHKAPYGKYKNIDERGYDIVNNTAKDIYYYKNLIKPQKEINIKWENNQIKSESENTNRKIYKDLYDRSDLKENWYNFERSRRSKEI